MSAAGKSTRRITRGRGHSYLLDGQPVPGVTTVLSKGLPKPALVPWAARTCGEYVVDHWDELATATPSERLTLVKGAPNAQRDAAAIRGQDVHTIAEQVLRGEEVEVPEHLRGYVDQCVAMLDTWNVQPVLSEAVVISRRWRYMGTLDTLATLSDGQQWLIDWKTSKAVYAEAALQLTAYANAELYLDRGGAEMELPVVDACGVVHLRHDGWDLLPVDSSESTFRVFLHALGIQRFQDGAADGVIGASLPRPITREEAAS